MKTSVIYARRIYYVNFNKRNIITDTIYSFSLKKNVDPSFFLALYYIEEYFRPKWYQNMELLFYKLKLLKDPSVGPFQVRISNLNQIRSRNKTILFKSLLHGLSLYKKSGLDKKRVEKKFISFGKAYNLDYEYGKVLYQLYQMLKKSHWTND